MIKKSRYIVQIVFLLTFMWLIANKMINGWMIIFAVSMIAALLLGRIFCGWICPMNTLMIPTEWLAKKLGIQTKKIPKILQSQKWAYILLLLLIPTVIISKRKGIQMPFLLYFLALSVLFTLRYKPEVWHKYLCPFGILQSLPGRFSRWTEKVKVDNCIGCRLCESACPAGAVSISYEKKKAKIHSTLCHQCFNCQEKCPADAIFYSKSKDNKELA
jgi:polyferredoxin